MPTPWTLSLWASTSYKTNPRGIAHGQGQNHSQAGDRSPVWGQNVQRTPGPQGGQLPGQEDQAHGSGLIPKTRGAGAGPILGENLR